MPATVREAHWDSDPGIPHSNHALDLMLPRSTNQDHVVDLKLADVGSIFYCESCLRTVFIKWKPVDEEIGAQRGDAVAQRKPCQRQPRR